MVFDYDQAVEFIAYRSQKKKAVVLEISGIDEGPVFTHRWQGTIFTLLPRYVRKNLFSPWVWALIQKG